MDMRIIEEIQPDDPYLNLAKDEMLLAEINSNPNECIARFWINTPSVVLGNSQKVMEEINIDFCLDNNILIARRITGGGAVYHDPGNLNMSVILPRSILPKNIEIRQINRFCTSLIISGLKNAGYNEIELNGSTNILYQGKKISGSAGSHKSKAILHHATLLFQADLERLNHALKACINQSDTSSGSKYFPTKNLPNFNINTWLQLVKKVLERKFKTHLINKKLSKEEEKNAHELSNSKYKKRNWIWKR
jgi:lipoate-protein ligase A